MQSTNIHHRHIEIHVKTKVKIRITHYPIYKR